MPPLTFDLPTILAGITVVALTAYVLAGGADFGGGVWDLFASGERRERQRDLVAHAIGPIWEANHVWLILVVVLLFTCFPPAFALLAITMHIPLALMLIGIVLRGSSFTFRAYGSETSAEQRRWGRTFAIASVVTPILLGDTIGALASSRVVAPSAGRFYDVFVAPWLAPFPLAVGVLTLALFAFLAAVYLTVEAHGTDLQEDFRRRALWAALAVFVAAFGTLGIALVGQHPMGRALVMTAWAIPLHGLTALAAITAIVALWTRRYHLARTAAIAQVVLILWGWAVAQYPYLVPSSLTIQDAAAPRRTLVLALIALAIGAVVLIPALWYLFRIFKGRAGAFAPMRAEPDEAPP